MEVISAEGFVISSTPYKESSRILNILTKEYGLIGVISKGCRGIKSKLRGVSENFSYATFHLYYRKDGLSTLIGGDIINYLIESKKNIMRLGYLTYICELTNNVCKHGEALIFDIFIAAILKIEEGFNPTVITNILELKYLDYLGIELNLDGCVVCGKTSVITLSPYKGGYVCSECREKEEIIDEKTIKMLRMYKYVNISGISNLDISEDVIKKIDEILKDYYEHFTGLYIKSKKFLETVK